MPVGLGSYKLSCLGKGGRGPGSLLAVPFLSLQSVVDNNLKTINRAFSGSVAVLIPLKAAPNGHRRTGKSVKCERTRHMLRLLTEAGLPRLVLVLPSNAHPPPHPPTTQAPTPQPSTKLPFFTSSSKHRAFSQRLIRVQTLACSPPPLSAQKSKHDGGREAMKVRTPSPPPLHPRTTYPHTHYPHRGTRERCAKGLWQRS